MWQSYEMRRAPIVEILVCVIAASVGLSVIAPATSAAGCAWATASAPNPGRQATAFYSVDGVADDLWIVGGYKNKGVPSKSLILHNTGSGWKVVKSPNIKARSNALGGVNFVGVGDVWAVGQAATARKGKSVVQHWDGTSWTMVSVPPSGKPFDALASIDATPPSDLPLDPLNPTQSWAVGQSTGESGKGAQALIAHSDGTSWELQTAPVVNGKHGLVSVLVMASDDVWAVGYSTAADEPRPLAMHFDGTAWTVVPTPAAGVGLGGSQLGAIAGSAPDDLWAVGYQGSGVPLVMHWDGIVWSQVINVPDTAGSDFLTSVSIDASGDLWAAGVSARQSGLKTLIQTMSGGTWSTESSPSPAWFNVLIDIAAVPEGAVWSVGFKFAKPSDPTATPRVKNLLLRCG